MTNGAHLHDVILDPISVLIYEYRRGSGQDCKIAGHFLLTTVMLESHVGKLHILFCSFF